MKRFLPFLLVCVICACDSDEDIVTDGTVLPQDSLNDSLTDTLSMDSLADSLALDSIPLSEGQLDVALDDILDGGNVATPEGAMSFCDCIKKISEIEEEMFEAEPDDWPDYTKQMEDLKNGPCYIINAGGGITTAEDKEAYQKKVKECQNQ